MISKVLRAIITGPPGSGKGTISERIIKDFGIKYLATSNLLREQIREETAVGLVADHHIKKGELVPDKLMIDLVSKEVAQMENTSWLLDGFPRTLEQAEILHKTQPADCVLYLNVPFDVIIERVRGRRVHLASGRVYHIEFNPPKVSGKDDITGEPLVQREDDKYQTVLERLVKYQSQTEPILEFYKERELLKEFRGKYSNDIWPRVHEFLSTKMEPLQYTEYK